MHCHLASLQCKSGDHAACPRFEASRTCLDLVRHVGPLALVLRPNQETVNLMVLWPNHRPRMRTSVVSCYPAPAPCPQPRLPHSSEATLCKAFHACSSPPLLQPSRILHLQYLSQESVNTMLSITHH
jgi:hypothetical protein